MAIRPLALAPPLAFAALVVLFYLGVLRENPDDLPSQFTGAPAPAVAAAALPGYDGVSAEELAGGGIRLVNFWASWCPPCLAEHPSLTALAAEGHRIAGVNMKDNAGDARAFLDRHGNPFSGVAFDPDGRTSIDWGVIAPPETFIIDGEGIVRYRFIGPLVGTDYEKRFLPEFRKALNRK